MVDWLRSAVGIVLGLSLIAWLAFGVVLPQAVLDGGRSYALGVDRGQCVRQRLRHRPGAGLGLRMGNVPRVANDRGSGVLSSMEMEIGPHNMMAALAMDMGIAPLILYIWLTLRMTWLGVRRLRGPAAVSPEWLVALWMFAYGFSSHNVLNEPAFVLGMGIAVSSFFAAASHAGSGRSGSRYLALNSPAGALGRVR